MSAYGPPGKFDTKGAAPGSNSFESASAGATLTPSLEVKAAQAALRQDSVQFMEALEQGADFDRVMHALVTQSEEKPKEVIKWVLPILYNMPKPEAFYFFRDTLPDDRKKRQIPDLNGMALTAIARKDADLLALLWQHGADMHRVLRELVLRSPNEDSAADAIKWLTQLKDKFDINYNDIARNAGRKKYFSILQREYLNGKYSRLSALIGLAEGGYAQALIRQLSGCAKQSFPQNPDLLVLAAAEKGHTGLVMSLIDEWQASLDYAIEGAAKGGHRELVKELLVKGAKITWAVSGAAQSGDQAYVKELNQRIPDGPLSAIEIVRSAAYGGQKKMVLSYLENPDIRRSIFTSVNKASKGGHLHLACALEEYDKILASNEGRPKQNILPGLVEGASEAGYHYTVESIIEQRSCDPVDFTSARACAAASGGHIPHVDELFTFPERINMTDFATSAMLGSHLIKRACDSVTIGIIFGKEIIRADINIVAAAAIQTGQLFYALQLFDKGADPGRFVQALAKNRFYNMIKRLISEGRVLSRIALPATISAFPRHLEDTDTNAKALAKRLGVTQEEASFYIKKSLGKTVDDETQPSKAAARARFGRSHSDSDLLKYECSTEYAESLKELGGTLRTFQPEEKAEVKAAIPGLSAKMIRGEPVDGSSTDTASDMSSGDEADGLMPTPEESADGAHDRCVLKEAMLPDPVDTHASCTPIADLALGDSEAAAPPAPDAINHRR